MGISRSTADRKNRPYGIIPYLATAGLRYTNWSQHLAFVDNQKADSVFSGISTFGRLPYFPCLASDDVKFDIAFIGTYPSYLYSIQTHQGIDANGLQELHSIQELHTDRVLGLAHQESDKVLAVSISSQCPQNSIEADPFVHTHRLT